jgi:hypothetical protein
VPPLRLFLGLAPRVNSNLVLELVRGNQRAFLGLQDVHLEALIFKAHLLLQMLKI